MSNPIVTVNVNIIAAPEPDNLQQMGAIISQGATNITPGEYEFLSQPADLTQYLTDALAITSLTWASGTVTATTAAAHGIPNGDEVEVVIAGALPAGYNGTFLATSTGPDTFT